MPGDNILAEFGSAVDAVQAAAAMQAQLEACNTQLPEGRRMRFRIGVNLGDVIVEDDRIYGDGINVAARVEKLADPGGICVSGKVYEEVHNKLDLAFESLGEHALHNIAASVAVYRVVLGAGAGRAPAEAAKAPAKPSIIVLPFVNMSGEAEQEFFADGLTEDIITELSRFRDLFVMSRNTSFKFRGKAVEVQKVCRELRVQYVIEGSVRKAGNRVRVTAQLIDGESDRHVWADRYDRQLDDIFAIQDEIAAAVVATLPGRIEAATRDRAGRKPTANMAAYECVLEAKALQHRSTQEDNARALRQIERAIELDPKYAHAHAWKACILGQAWTYGWCADGDATSNEVAKELEIALSLDDRDSDVHRILAGLHIARNEHDKALYHQQQALSLNPNDDGIVVQQGELLTWLGQPEEGIEWIRKAMRLNPYHPDRYWNHLGRAYFVARRYAEAVEAMQRISAPDHYHLAFLAACYARMGDAAAAAEHVREVLKRRPTFRVDKHCLRLLHYKHPDDLAHHRESLLEAGIPA
jgi:adenylate cyclase